MKIGDLDRKIARWHGVKFDNTFLDAINYTLPRVSIITCIVLLLL